MLDRRRRLLHRSLHPLGQISCFCRGALFSVDIHQLTRYREIKGIFLQSILKIVAGIFPITGKGVRLTEIRFRCRRCRIKLESKSVSSLRFGILFARQQRSAYPTVEGRIC